MQKKISTSEGIAFIILASLLMSLFFWKFNQLSNYQGNKIVEQKIETGSKTFTNNYWGFRVSYPKDWHVVESDDSGIYYFVSYSDKSKDKELMFPPNQNEFRIKVSIKQSVSSKDTANKNDYSDGLLISGEKSEKAIFYQRPLSGYDGNRALSAGLTREQINKGHSILQYVIRHNGYTYTLEGEPADSKILSEFDDFLHNFRFIERIEYSSQSQMPQEGNKVYEDKALGYSFEYPSDWYVYNDELVCDDNGGDNRLSSTGSMWVENFERPNCENIDQINSVNESAKLLRFKVDSLGKIEDKSSLEQELKQYAACDISGPPMNGDISCPEENMKIEEFTNNNGIKGIKLLRKVIYSTNPGNEKVINNDFLIAFKLSSDLQNYKSAILFSPDDPTISNAAVKKKILEMANTFDYLQRK
jgi:hypothetical protein